MKLSIKFYLLLTLCALFYSSQVVAQKEIKIGEKCPDILLNHIVNYKTGAVKISDFKNKLLILDFWATWCNPCVHAFPLMDSIQKKFNGKLQILPVTTQDAKTVTTFFNKMYNAQHILPISVTDDTTLSLLFKHTYLPHFVWIDEKGIVSAITSEEQVTYENIEAAVNGEKIVFERKEDIDKGLDESKAAFVISNPIIKNGTRILDSINNSNLIYHSTLTGFISGVPGYESMSDSTRITAMNQPIANLYSIAAGHFKWDLLMPNRQKIEIKDSSLYFKLSGQFPATKKYVEGDEYNEWAKENAVCYELKLPDNLRSKKFEIMLNDLNTLFGSLYNIQGGLEKRQMKALVLKRITDEDKLKTKGINKPYQQNAYFYGLYNEPFNYFIDDIRQYYQLNYALVDETGYTGKVDLELNCNLSDLKQLNSALYKYGLKFIEDERDVDMIVIKEKTQHN